MKILVFAPHPDDMEFFMAGTVVRHLERGDEITEVLFTHGENELSSFYKNDNKKNKRKKEAELGARILGIKDIRFLDFIAKNIEHNKESIEKIRQVLSEYKPEVIYAPAFQNRIDLWIKDHIQAARVIREAYHLFKQGRMLLYGSIKPHILIPVTKYNDRIKKALDQHQTQKRYLRMVKPVRLYFLKKWGKKIKNKHAEGFEEYIIKDI